MTIQGTWHASHCTALNFRMFDGVGSPNPPPDKSCGVTGDTIWVARAALDGVSDKLSHARECFVKPISPSRQYDVSTSSRRSKSRSEVVVGLSAMS